MRRSSFFVHRYDQRPIGDEGSPQRSTKSAKGRNRSWARVLVQFVIGEELRQPVIKKALVTEPGAVATGYKHSTASHRSFCLQDCIGPVESTDPVAIAPGSVTARAR